MLKYKNLNIADTANRIKWKFEDTEPTIRLHGFTTNKSKMADGRHLEKNRYDVITQPPIVRLMKLGKQMQNDMEVTTHRS